MNFYRIKLRMISKSLRAAKVRLRQYEQMLSSPVFKSELTVRELVQRNRRITEALIKYGAHMRLCIYFPCTCGLDDEIADAVTN